MTNLNRVLCCFVLIASAMGANTAQAWHGWRHFHAHGYGFGLNHHSFAHSIYHPGWSSYSRVSFYGNLGYWPSYYGVGYYAPTYYLPLPVYRAYYTPVVAPVIYSNFYSGFPTCSVTPALTTPASINTVPLATYTAKKPLTSAVPFRLASQPAQQPSAGRYVMADASVTSPTIASSSALDTAPEELLTVADRILAAGGYRQAAQAYGQLVVQYGNSDRLATRRFVAQVANGDFEQAAVVVELAIANGNQFNRADLPQGELQAALGNKNGLIAQRIESLAANALQKSEDAVPMLAVANWLALSGDDERANLFKAHAEQLQKADVGLLVHQPAATRFETAH